MRLSQVNSNKLSGCDKKFRQQFRQRFPSRGLRPSHIQRHQLYITIHQRAGKEVPNLLGLPYTIANHSMLGGRQECVYDQESGHIGCEDSGSGISAKEFFGPGHHQWSECVFQRLENG